MGDAFVALETTVLGGKRAFELQILNPTNRSTTHGGYSIELQEVSPYPFGSQPIKAADYRASSESRKTSNRLSSSKLWGDGSP